MHRKTENMHRIDVKTYIGKPSMKTSQYTEHSQLARRHGELASKYDAGRLIDTGSEVWR